MQTLISIASALIVITAYCMGVWTGSHFYCTRATASEVEAKGTEQKISKVGKSLFRKEASDGDNCLNRPARKESDNLGGSDISAVDAERQTMRETENQKQSDAERQRQFEEDLKAFEACMNYSAERAYDMLKGFSAE